MRIPCVYKYLILVVFAGWWPLVLNVHAEENTLQDPTKPPIDVLSRMPGNMAASDTQSLVLSGLKISGAQSVAIVNNSFVKIGDVVQGYRFTGIKGEQAVFEDNSHQKLLLKPNIVDYRKFELKKNISKKRHKHSTTSKKK